MVNPKLGSVDGPSDSQPETKLGKMNNVVNGFGWNGNIVVFHNQHESF